jgi:DNA-directed RNA polymerase specialized sigma24 family protein
MDDTSQGSVTAWLGGLKAGNDVAAQQLWNRYFGQLVTLARHRLQGLTRESDEEDVALSALKSAMIRVQNNCFPDLHDRTDLWPLLITITSRKATNEIKRQRTKKRDCTAEAHILDLDELVRYEPTPEFVVQLVEEIEKLTTALGDATLRKIIACKLEGYTNEETASKLNVSSRTVVRKLHRIRQEWEETD